MGAHKRWLRWLQRADTGYLEEQLLPQQPSTEDRGAAGLDVQVQFLATSLRLRERVIRMWIAALIPMFGVMAALMLFSKEGPSGFWPRLVVIVVAASTLPAAALFARSYLTPMWWAQPPGLWDASNALVLYGDLGVTVVLATYSNPESALFGTLLFAIISTYVAHFCNTKVRAFHIVWTTIVIVYITVVTYTLDKYDIASLLARFCVAVTVVNGTVLLQGMFIRGVRNAIHQTLLHANQDVLTQLWNRRGFSYWALSMLRSSSGSAGILFVDIDNLKAINDTHGHQRGDEVLQLTARRLQEVVGSIGVLARTGGDEFAFAAELGLDQLTDLAESILRHVHNTDDVVPITASIGVAGERSDDAAVRGARAESRMSTLLRAADTALYEAKQSGRNRFAVGDPERTSTG